MFLNGLNRASIGFPIASRSFTNTRVGWTAGGGIQYAVTDNWWVFGEYRYTNFGSFNDGLFNTFSPGGVRLGQRFVDGSRQIRENQVQVGFSYRFNLLPPPPVVAKY